MRNISMVQLASQAIHLSWQGRVRSFFLQPSQIDNVYNYILNQEEAPQERQTFKEEYL